MYPSAGINAAAVAAARHPVSILPTYILFEMLCINVYLNSFFLLLLWFETITKVNMMGNELVIKCAIIRCKSKWFSRIWVLYKNKYINSTNRYQRGRENVM